MTRKAKHAQRMKAHDAFNRRLKSGFTSRHSRSSLGRNQEFVPFEEPDIDSKMAIKQKIIKRFNEKLEHK